MTDLPPFNGPPPKPTDLPPFNSPPQRSEVHPIGESVPVEPVPAKEPPPSRWQGARSLSVWILRWALLGVGVGGAWLFGILVAQFFPASDPEPPIQEIAARRINRFSEKVGRLPDWWAGDTVQTPPVGVSPVDTAPPTTAPATRPVTLTDSQREQVAVELDAIEAELQRLRDRASAVEQQLGLPTTDSPLAERLNNAENRLSPPTEAAQATDTPSSETLRTVTTTAPDPLFQANAYRVTLPSDVLFPPGDAALQPNARPLLDSILQDVGRYPGATIVVGSYTDIEDENTPTELSYKQAIAVQQYLSQRLGDSTYHWVTVGYGNSSLGSTGGVQLSRRVSIAIIP